MPELTLVLFSFAWFLAGFLNGITGMGAAMVALPIVATFMPAQMLVPVTCLLVTITSAHMAWIYRRECRSISLKFLLIGALPGSVAGLFILLLVPGSIIQFVAGIIMVFFVLWQVLPKTEAHHLETKFLSILTGFTSGFMASSLSFGNPPVGMYAIRSGWTQKETLGTMNVFVLIVYLITCVVHASAGLYSVDMLEYLVWGFPATMAGLLLALPVAKRIKPETFKKILLLIIALSACMCIVRSIEQWI